MSARFALELKSRSDLQTIAKAHGIVLTLVDCGPLDKDGMVMLLHLEGAQKSIRDTIATMRRMQGVRQVYEGDSTDNGTRLMVVLQKPGVCRSSSGLNLLCLDCPFNSTEAPAKWSFIVRNPHDFETVARRLRRQGLPNRVVDSSPLRDEPTMTPRQKEVIATAFSSGYFDFPRKISLSDLGKLTGMTPSEILDILGPVDQD
jgi:predicted DNA binding protein